MNILVCILLSYGLSHLWRDKMKLYHKPLQGFRKYGFLNKINCEQITLVFYAIFRDESYVKFSNFFCVQNVKLKTCTIPKDEGGEGGVRGDSFGMLSCGHIYL
jgi:hypothetical protein